MKKYKMFTLMFLLVIAILGIVLPASGEEKVKKEAVSKEAKTFTIAQAVVGTGIENREPIGVAEKFPNSVEKVYCFLEATNIAQDLEVSLAWLHNGSEMSKLNLPLKMGAKWRTWAFKNISGLKGDLKVEIKDASGNLLKDVKFKVE